MVMRMDMAYVVGTLAEWWEDKRGLEWWHGWDFHLLAKVDEKVDYGVPLAELEFVHDAGYEDPPESWDTVSIWPLCHVSVTSSWDDRWPALCADQLRDLCEICDKLKSAGKQGSETDDPAEREALSVLDGLSNEAFEHIERLCDEAFDKLDVDLPRDAKDDIIQRWSEALVRGGTSNWRAEYKKIKQGK